MLQWYSHICEGPILSIHCADSWPRLQSSRRRRRRRGRSFHAGGSVTGADSTTRPYRNFGRPGGRIESPSETVSKQDFQIGLHGTSEALASTIGIAWRVIAFQTQPNINTPSPSTASFLYHGDIGIELIDAHTNARGPAIIGWVMAGKNDSLSVASNR